MQKLNDLSRSPSPLDPDGTLGGVERPRVRLYADFGGK
jgi:hypothetical protein